MTDTERLLEQHEREHHAFLQLTDTEKARAQLRNYARYKDDPWSFLTDCVYTLDQVDINIPIKPFPSYFEYLHFLSLAWKKHKMIAVPKSRRMTCSWGFISLFTHDTIFHKGRFNGFVSKKEDDAGDLVSRAEFIYQNIPTWRIPKDLLPAIGGKGTMTKSPPILEFPELRSKIQGFPMGADQLRQFTLSGILGDECAFWEQAEKFYSATKPTIDGGGRMVLISSRSPGFFKKLVFDKLNHPDLNFPERAPVPVKHPLVGVEIWKNPENQFLIVDLHYTANPAKRSTEWKRAIKGSMPARQFDMEYEKSWATFEGLPVYGDTFDRTYHVVRKAEPEPGIPLLIGWDFGLTPAAVVAQLIETRLVILAEYVGTNEAIKTFAPKVWQDLNLKYGPHIRQADDMIYSFIDPAGFQRAQTDARTCAEVMRNSGFRNIEPGPVDFESRKGAVEGFLTRHTKGGPGMQLDERTCPILIDGFAGGYQYPEKATDVEPTKLRPVKNAHSHPHDALQYLAWGATKTARRYNIDIPMPHYGFLKEGTR